LPALRIPALRQWDVVLADAVVQHDMDARPLFPRFTLPALKQDRLQPQPAWFDWAKTALVEAHSAGDLGGFARPPSSGLIATGDRFIGDPAVLQALRDALPDLQAVEMEGAAVAQVAEQEGVPLAGAAGDFRWCRRRRPPKASKTSSSATNSRPGG
jgi:adenosylhomocysteine nucleosidase